MQESAASVSRSFPWPLWARIAFACFMFAVSAVAMWVEFYRFNWVGFLCAGLLSLIFVPMQRGEATRAYFSEPRRIISFALIIVIMAAALHSLYYIFTKHF
jgi:hypothetical protein